MSTRSGGDTLKLSAWSLVATAMHAQPSVMLLAKVSNCWPKHQFAASMCSTVQIAGSRPRHSRSRSSAGGPGTGGRAAPDRAPGDKTRVVQRRIRHEVRGAIRRDRREPDLQHLIVAGGRLGGRHEQRVDRIAPAVAVGVDDERLGLVVQHVDDGLVRIDAARSASASGPPAWLPSSWMRARRSNTCGTMLLSLGMSPMRLLLAQRIELPRADEPFLAAGTTDRAADPGRPPARCCRPRSRSRSRVSLPSASEARNEIVGKTMHRSLRCGGSLHPVSLRGVEKLL